MEPINRYSLEDFAERHRSDFDLHEPRPELWEMLATQLDADAAARPGQLHMSIAPAELLTAENPAAPVAKAEPPQLAPMLRVQRRQVRWQPLGIVLGLVALVMTLGLSRWNANSAPVVSVAAGTTVLPPDAALYLPVSNANEGGANSNGNARLDTAVHGMERYYAVQLAERKAQLTQLDPDNQAEWAQDLAGLDSIYRQLKHELPQHPQPEVVLTAMNRNLQTRLDILDQQLTLRGDAQVAQRTPMLGSEYVLADSRAVADNLIRRHER